MKEIRRRPMRADNLEPAAPHLAVVVPALREAQNLPRLLTRTRKALCGLNLPYEIVVVDDDSRDGTREIVSAIASEDPRVRLLVREGERGLAGAILHGWQNTVAPILGVIDADGQHPPELLPRLLESVMDGSDVVIASRFVRGGKDCGSNLLRRTISAAAILLTRPLQREWLRVADPLSGFFLVRRRCVESVLFQPAGFKLLLEILVRGRIHSVQELPFAFARRNAGRSKISLRVGWDYLSLLARLYATKFGRTGISQPASGD
ncbi:MAG TPA: polyprenol monophosphomannose synthase [Terracidiphilus sp.]